MIGLELLNRWKNVRKIVVPGRLSSVCGTPFYVRRNYLFHALQPQPDKLAKGTLPSSP